jgi:transposase
VAPTEYRQARPLLGQAEARLDALAQADAGVQTPESIPGVGTRTAEVVVAYLGEPRRFRAGQQVSAYAGLVPRQSQPGESGRRGRVPRRGPALLRERLVGCAWVTLRYHGWARTAYERLSRGKARKEQAVVALARKLLVRCWAMPRDRARGREGAAAPGEAVPA